MPDLIIEGSSVSYTIEDSAFEDCTFLTSVTIPSNVVKIGGDAFYGCTGLKVVYIDNSVTTISGNAFYQCTALKSVYYNGTATQWASISFGINWANPLIYAGNLYLNGTLATDITLEDITSVKAYAFYGCTSIKSVIIPESVTSIGNYAFGYCTSLISISIPDGVTYIGGFAFCGCSKLTSITIPNSVTILNEYAFYNSTSIENVYYTGTEDEWNNNSMFSDNDNLAGAVVYYYSEAQPTEEGNYWHYDANGDVAVWSVE